MAASGRRWIKWVLILVALAVLAAAGLLIWYVFIRDVADPLDESDLDQALNATTTTLAVVTSDPPSPSGDQLPESTPPATDPGTQPQAPAGGSAWTVTTDASTVGYRVKEVLFGLDAEGVGRTNQVTGSLTFDGTILTSAEFTVDVASIESDDSRRDGQFRGGIMSVDEFPTATFVLTEPIDVGTEPVDGAEVTVTAAGDLTLRGVTNPVTFELTGRVENGRIGVLGNIAVVFADYGIANPSRAGITTEDDGLLEFVLVFAPVG